MELAHLQHLYNRIGFGVTPKQLKSLSTKSKKEIIDDLFLLSEKGWFIKNKLKVDLFI